MGWDYVFGNYCVIYFKYIEEGIFIIVFLLLKRNVYLLYGIGYISEFTTRILNSLSTNCHVCEWPCSQRRKVRGRLKDNNDSHARKASLTIYLPRNELRCLDFAKTNNHGINFFIKSLVMIINTNTIPVQPIFYTIYVI